MSQTGRGKSDRPVARYRMITGDASPGHLARKIGETLGEAPRIHTSGAPQVVLAIEDVGTEEGIRPKLLQNFYSGPRHSDSGLSCASAEGARSDEAKRRRGRCTQQSSRRRLVWRLCDGRRRSTRLAWSTVFIPCRLGSGRRRSRSRPRRCLKASGAPSRWPRTGSQSACTARSAS